MGADIAISAHWSRNFESPLLLEQFFPSFRLHAPQFTSQFDPVSSLDRVLAFRFHIRRWFPISSEDGLVDPHIILGFPCSSVWLRLRFFRFVCFPNCRSGIAA